VTFSIDHSLSIVVARDLPEAWYLCLKGIMNHGYEYLITRGSFQGQKRRELDSIALQILYPSSKPMVPDTPEGVPPPCSMDYVEQYLPYLMTSDKSQGELYTYGEDIDTQLPELIRILKEAGEGTNQACMSVGSKQSMFLEHSQCLRVIDTRIREGKLHFHVYFRSWDLWAGFPANLAAVQVLKEYVASEVGVEDGPLFAYSKGLHLYDHHWELARRVIER
jgi:thymidylate synthase